MNPIPPYPSLNTLVEMLDAGETTSTAIVSELVDRARAATNLNAYITLDTEGALARARELDEMREQGNILGPLHGTPLVVKDNIHVAGLPNTAGTPGLANFTPETDSPTVAALRAAGAIILGKTNLHELAYGITSYNASYGSVGNPFDPTTFAGGSSGGTASAVSAGLAPAGLGTDTGGSVRIPASLTGVVGFRPSTDRYDSSAVTPVSHTRDTVGIIARDVDDVILIDGVIGSNDAVWSMEPGDIRLGIAREYYFDNIDKETAMVIEAALGRLREAGLTLVEEKPGDVGAMNAESAFPIVLREVVGDLSAYLDENMTGTDFSAIRAAAANPDVKGLFAILDTAEGHIPDKVYAHALSVRENMRAMWHDYFAQYDLDGLIFPTTLLPARPIEGSLESVELNGKRVPTFQTYTHNTDPATIAALPGVSLPAGITHGGLPVGIEIDGPEGSDRKLLALADVLENIFNFTVHPKRQA